MERTKDEYQYFIVKISFKNSQLTGKLVFLANSFGERTVSVIRIPHEIKAPPQSSDMEAFNNWMKRNLDLNNVSRITPAILYSSLLSCAHMPLLSLLLLLLHHKLCNYKHNFCKPSNCQKFTFLALLLSLSRSLSVSLGLSRSLSVSLCLSVSLSLPFSFSLSLTHARALSLSLARSLSFTLCLSCSPFLILSRALSLFLSRSFSSLNLALCVSVSLPFTWGCRPMIYSGHVYIYVYTYLYVHIYIYIYMDISIYTYAQVHIHIYVCVHIYMYINIHTYTCTYTYTYTYTHTYMYTYTYTYT